MLRKRRGDIRDAFNFKHSSPNFFNGCKQRFITGCRELDVDCSGATEATATLRKGYLTNVITRFKLRLDGFLNCRVIGVFTYRNLNGGCVGVATKVHSAISSSTECCKNGLNSFLFKNYVLNSLGCFVPLLEGATSWELLANDESVSTKVTNEVSF